MFNARLLRIAVVVCLVIAAQARGVSEISQYGITWTFDREVTKGQFVNGDWWVVGPVTVVSVMPAPVGTGEDARNGSVVNPDLAHYPDTNFTAAQYDGRIHFYDGTERATFPLVVQPNQSLVSTQSIMGVGIDMNEASADPMGIPTPKFYRSFDRATIGPKNKSAPLKNAAILTVLAAPPPALCFRPPYVGDQKPLFEVASLRTNLLPRLKPPMSAPEFGPLNRCFQRPWTDIAANYFATEYAAAENMPFSYGREFCRVTGDAGLLLCCDFPLKDKEPVMYGLVQHGIDCYYAAKIDPKLWTPNGGYKSGRKFPILFAAMMLGQDWDLTGVSFQEDIDYYFGDDANPPEVLWTGWQKSGNKYAANVLRGLGHHYEGYDASEWHTLGTAPWDKPEGYGRLNSRALVGPVTAAMLMGLKPAWKNDALFAYIDRWMNENDAAARDKEAEAAREHDWDSVNNPRSKYSWNNADGILYTPHQGEAGTPFAKTMYLEYRGSVP